MCSSDLRNLTLSPDGARVAYSEAVEPLAAPTRRSVFVIDRRTPSAPPQQVSAAPGKTVDERAPEFSPDGKSLAILSDAGGNGVLRPPGTTSAEEAGTPAR